ncbi:MAG: glycosyltransferase, partial [Candidatus Heimdallarchaeota archaeon]|nr:glycosyltransferase [Candidatus Heimdallarchaeota archaeon]
LKLTYRYLCAPKHDVVIVGYSGQIDVFLAKILTTIRRKPLILDAFLSLYDAAVNDRQMISKKSLFARLLFFFDKYACILADQVYLDTKEHINYFCEEFGLNASKFIVIPIGANQELFKCTRKRNVKRNKPLRIIYFGSYIPLQGVEYIIDAITLLKKNKHFKFILIGTGQLFPKIKRLVRERNLNNVQMINTLPPEQLVAEITKSDIALGIFGLTAKMSRVVPFKVYESLAVGLPVITGDSPAIRRNFKNGEHLRLVQPGSGEAIRDGLIRLQEDPALQEKIAEGGHNLFNQKFNTAAIGKKVKESTEKLLAKAP